ncbi:MAG: beta-ketoacyl-ACP synthase II [candidate division Zixibacteria bacterium]|nr:beta-ketoacyl-ACP synthase II [candidate division Zixibacteria bacterium]
MTGRRVAITGLGVVAPNGNNVEEFWDNLVAGRGGAGRVTHFDVDEFSSQVACEVKNFEPERYVNAKALRRMDTFVQYALAGAVMAMQDAGLEVGRDELDATRIGVIVGSGIGGIGVIEEQHALLLEKGPRRVTPLLIPMLISNMASGQLSIYFNAKGPNSCVVTACATAAHSIGDAYRVIERGDADVMIAGGTEAAITPLGFAGFCVMKAMSTRNDDPEHASRPFDRERDGFVVGEGAGILILEEYERAKRRGADVYAEVAGYGITADAYHITAPDPEGDGSARAMKMALEHAGLNPEDVHYINAHGTSTPLNDVAETLAIKKVFGEHAYKVPISSTKSMTGHLLGAAGGAESVAAILTIKKGVIHPTINYEYPDPECDLDYVPNDAREADVKAAITNSFAFGGQNATLVFKRV